MDELTGKERISRTLKREPIDRVGVFESFWSDTHRAWASQSHISENEDLKGHFELDLRDAWAFNPVANLDFEDEIVEETDETKLVRSGDGALLRWWKDRQGTPEHVDFLVKDRQTWQAHARDGLTNADNFRRRIDFEGYRNMKAKCEREDLFFCWSGVNVFECMHPVTGHENMLVGMALDPEWVRDMCKVYSDLTINLLEILFAEEGPPDGMYFHEDMGFKHRPFMSPAMYKDIVWPAHKRTFDYSHSLDLPVIVHSCGFVEPLSEGLIEAGMDCLQAMEVKAGMDLLKLKKDYGDRITLFGGMDIRTLETNDKSIVEAELAAKLPRAMEGGGYILHTDHSVSSRVDYDTYKFFLDRAREMGRY